GCWSRESTASHSIPTLWSTPGSNSAVGRASKRASGERVRVGRVDDLSLAAELVREAGTLASEVQGNGLGTRYKTSSSDVVSAADHAAEERITRRLAENRPDDGLVGEEGARKGRNGRAWDNDSGDGKYKFLSGIPYWCSAVGLVDADGPLLGAVYYPAVDQLWLGGREFPTTLNGE